jgi:PAS domain S-box-containing protein
VTDQVARARPLGSLGSDVVSVMHEIVEQLLELPGADGASLSEIDGESVHFDVSLGADAPLAGKTFTVSDGAGALTLSMDGPVVIRAEPGTTIPNMLLDGAVVIMLAPVSYGGATRGILGVRSTEPDAFDEADRALLGMLARSAGIALRNAALVDNLRAVIDTQSELSALELDHNAVLQAIVSRVQRLTRADGAVVATYEGDEVVWSLASGACAEFLGFRHPRRGNVGGLAEELNTTIYVEDTFTDPSSDPEIQARVQMRSLITAPLHRDGNVIGILATMTRKPGAFDTLAVETVALMAEFVSAVMRNAEELESRQVLVEHLEVQSREFEESEERFRSAFFAATIGMSLTDLNGRFVMVNDTLETMLGYEPGELIDTLAVSVLHDDDVPAVQALTTELLAGLRDQWTHELRARRKDGGELWIRLSTSIVRDYAGEPVRFVTHVENISDQRELEHQLRHAQKMEAVGRLAGGVAHDFNNLLTAITGYTQFLIDGLEDEKLLRHAEEIKRASARAASLTGQLLAFSRRQVLQPRVIDLNTTVTDMDMMLRRLIGEDVELITQLEPDLGSVRADPTQIEQVIINVAVNARDAMPHGGAFTIVTERAEVAGRPGVSVVMTDNGVGMTADQRARLFDPFFTTKEGGTGLGLATVYGIVEQSGGTIDVASEPGFGTSIRMTLPRVDPEIDQAGAGEPVIGRTAQPGTETVLLVEDETVVRQLVAEILETSGYTVLQAADGASAIEVLRRHSGNVALLLTDVVMPGMSGREVARAVTAMRPGTPVLYMSGYTDSTIDQHGVLEPGVQFLQKPFSAEELTHLIRAILDGAPAV